MADETLCVRVLYAYAVAIAVRNDRPTCYHILPACVHDREAMRKVFPQPLPSPHAASSIVLGVRRTNLHAATAFLTLFSLLVDCDTRCTQDW